jgi:tRNA G18 (ribose-2'-O)-methylase SpoU
VEQLETVEGRRETETAMSLSPIASIDDPRLAAYRTLADPAALIRSGLLVAEGRLVVRRLLVGGRFAVHSILVTSAARQWLADVLIDEGGVPVFVVEQGVMNAVAGFNIHRGCLALAERPACATLTAADLGAASRVLVLEGVNNPDNIGGLFRSAAAFGVNLVVLGPGCSDPWYRKAIRTSMAATLQVPFVAAGAWPDGLDLLRGHGFALVALSPARDATAIEDMPRNASKLALLVGAEGEGLSPAALAHADHVVRIAMTPGVDSLNVTVAASIALHYVFTMKPAE